MKEQLVGFEVAKKAKGVGFNITTRNFYADSSWNSIEIYSCNEVGYDEFTDSMEKEHGFGDIILVPTQSLLQKWLREVHKIDIYILGYGFGYYAQLNNVPPANQGDVKYIDRRWNMPPEEKNSGNLRTYEEALEHGLMEGLKLIK